MANNDYVIEYSNKKDTITIKENHIDNTTTSLALVGHGQATYGPAQNTNFLHLLENFASAGTEDEPEPQHPVLGQIWFKNIGGGKFELNVCSDLSNTGEPTWSKMSQVITSPSGSNYDDGDLYYDKESKKLKVYDTEVGGWISVGPTDVVHTQHIFDSVLVPPQAREAIYDKFDMSIISENLTETGNADINGSGSVSLVKMTILAKEFKDGGVISPAEAKCCAWVYKFLARCVKTGSDETAKTIQLVGAPSYELIAKNPESLDWNVTIDIDQSTGTPQLLVRVDLNPSTSNYISFGFDSEITRI